MRPVSNRAAKIARLRSYVNKAIIFGPGPPAPAGLGLDVVAFQKSLPWFKWRQLVKFAFIFGERRIVVKEVAAKLAVEVHRRICNESHDQKPEHIRDIHDAAAENIRRTAITSHEITAIAQSYAKIEPFLPEYSLVYDSVSFGVLNKMWEFNRLQTVLIGTALVEVNLHLSSTLPILVRSSLLWARNAGISQLRFLLHSCTRLPPPGLSPAAVTVLVARTEYLVGLTNFALTTHIAVSWLRIRVPDEVKSLHLRVLRLTWSKLHNAVPMRPAFPLPSEGLAPAVVSLLPRQCDQISRSMLPPVVQSITAGLVTITRGLLAGGCSNDALDFDDWARILNVVIEFCDRNASLVAQNVGSVQPLPRWAVTTLGFVTHRAPELHRKDIPPKLDSLLALLPLVRQRLLPAQRSLFFTWAAKQVAEHKNINDSEKLAKAISEVVPCLAGHQSITFTQTMLSNPQISAISFPSSLQNSHAKRPRQVLQIPSEVKLVHSVEPGSLPLRQVSQVSRHEKAAPTESHVEARLWGSLSDCHASVVITDPKELPVREEVVASEVSEPEEVTAEVSNKNTATLNVDRLQLQLEGALNRIEGLEAQLQEAGAAEKARQSQHMRDKAERCEQPLVQAAQWIHQTILPRSSNPPVVRSQFHRGRSWGVRSESERK